MIRRLKRRDRLKVEGKMWVEGRHDGPRRHYYSLYLWESREAMVEDGLPLDDDWSDGCIGVCCQAGIRIQVNGDGSEQLIDLPKLGEIHFVGTGKWTLEIVAHEITHAMLQAARLLGPSFEELEAQETMLSEERFCYRLGACVDAVYAWLWKHDTPGGWGSSTARKSDRLRHVSAPVSRPQARPGDRR